MKNRWKQSSTCVYNTSYHIIFCPKYRRKVLVGDIENRLKELIIEKCDEMGVEMRKMEVMPDHVHLFLRALPIHAPHFVIAQIKGYTSRKLRKEIPALRSRLPTLWTRSYFVESVGHISQRTIEKYIEGQKGK